MVFHAYCWLLERAALFPAPVYTLLLSYFCCLLGEATILTLVFSLIGRVLADAAAYVVAFGAAPYILT